MLRFQGTSLDGGSGFVQDAGQFTAHPVRGRLRLRSDLDGLLEPVGHGAFLDQLRCVVLGQAEAAHKTLPARVGKLGKCRADVFHHFLVHRDRHKVRIGEIAVIVGLLFGTH